MRKLFLIVFCVVISILNMNISAKKKKDQKIKEGIETVISSIFGGSGGTNNQTTPPKPSPKKEEDNGIKAISGIEGLEVKVKTCEADENDNVVIVFTIKNVSKHDARCQIRSGSSEAYDDEGNIYKGNSIRFALANETFMENCEAGLPRDVTTKYKMKISEVDPAASKLDLVKIYLYELPIGSMTGDLKLKNLPITRPGD